MELKIAFAAIRAQLKTPDRTWHGLEEMEVTSLNSPAPYNGARCTRMSQWPGQV